MMGHQFTSPLHTIGAARVNVPCMKTRDCFKTGLALVSIILCLNASAAESAGQLPVVEVTAFKDGHAFVVQEGPVSANNSHEVFLDQVPSPVLGTLWTYSADPKVKLTSVVAGQRIVPINRSALSLGELIEANHDAPAVVTETNQVTYDATIIGFLTRSSKELSETSPPGTREQLPQQGHIVLLKTDHGTKALPVEQIQSLTFKNGANLKAPQDEFRNYLRLKLDGAGKNPTVGMVYLQKGFRWIPSYRVELDGNGQATVKLQAILVNELIDLTNVTLNLVIGVPSFAFKDTVDPMAVQEAATQLSQYFQGATPAYGRQVLAQSFNNSIMSQVPTQFRGGAPVAAESSGPPTDLPAGAKNEDLYVFTLHGITLRKGERMLVPVSEQTVKYHDVFTMDIPFAPPSELGRNIGGQQQMELARLMNSPTVMHKARLTNSTAQPFTTAPALILRNGKVIAQSLMTYTASGASGDLSLTTAVDIQVKKSDSETGRTGDALVHEGDHYFRVDLKGQIHIVNRRGTAVDLEVNRYVLGQANKADNDGKIEMTNFFEDRQYMPATGTDDMAWMSWFNWPWWWNRVNGAGRITWNLKLDPGQSIDLGYTWHYFWR